MEASDAAAVIDPGDSGVSGGADGVEMMYEYAVGMVCEKCSEAVHKALDGMANVTSVTTNVQAQLVVVEGSFAPAVIVETLERIGRKVKLIGSGLSLCLARSLARARALSLSLARALALALALARSLARSLSLPFTDFVWRV